MGLMPDIDLATRDALQLAEESPNEAALARLRHRKRFIIGRRIAFLAVAFIIGVGLAIYFAGQIPRPSRAQVLPWMKTTGLCLTIAGILLEIVYFVLVIRNGEFSAGWRSPSLVLGWRQRRAIRQQIRGNRPVDPALLPISRELALRTKRAKIIVMMVVAFSLILAGQIVRSGSTTQLFVGSAIGVLYLALVPYIFWESRRASRFLSQNPLPEA